MFFRQSLLAGLLCVALVHPVAANADMLPPSHGCVKPYKPYEFTSESQVQAFRSDVEMYRMCISDFVDEQTDAAATHEEAAEQAIRDWNNFVDFELQ